MHSILYPTVQWRYLILLASNLTRPWILTDFCVYYFADMLELSSLVLEEFTCKILQWRKRHWKQKERVAVLVKRMRRKRVLYSQTKGIEFNSCPLHVTVIFDSCYHVKLFWCVIFSILEYKWTRQLGVTSYNFTNSNRGWSWSVLPRHTIVSGARPTPSETMAMSYATDEDRPAWE